MSCDVYKRGDDNSGSDQLVKANARVERNVMMGFGQVPEVRDGVLAHCEENPTTRAQENSSSRARSVETLSQKSVLGIIISYLGIQVRRQHIRKYKQ